MTKTITGKVSYQNIEGGFWGIIDESGEKWLILNMPEQIKYHGKSVEVTIRPVDAMSMYMWGNPANIISFETLMP